MKKTQPKRGRPSKQTNEAKSLLMQVRVSAPEKQGFSEAAALDGQELSVWVRQVLRIAAETQLRHRGLAVPFAAVQTGKPPP